MRRPLANSAEVSGVKERHPEFVGQTGCAHPNDAYVTERWERLRRKFTRPEALEPVTVSFPPLMNDELSWAAVRLFREPGPLAAGVCVSGWKRDNASATARTGMNGV